MMTTQTRRREISYLMRKKRGNRSLNYKTFEETGDATTKEKGGV